MVTLIHCTCADIDIKLAWFSKLLEALTQIDPATGNMVANYANICTALDLFSFLLQVLPHQVVLTGFRTLHKGVSICMTCNNTKVVRYVHTLLTRLISMFPTDLGKDVGMGMGYWNGIWEWGYWNDNMGMGYWIWEWDPLSHIEVLNPGWSFKSI